MIGKVLGAILIALVFRNAQGGDPPKVNGSFIAWGEIVQPAPGMGGLVVLQMAFEESYDEVSENSAFFLWMAGKNLTFVKNHKINQTFLYLGIEEKDKNKDKKKEKMECLETTEKEWLDTDFAPGLLSYEGDDGTVKFSLTQLFNIPNNYLEDEKLQGVATTYRGIPAKSWTHRIKGKNSYGNDTTLMITSYWSDGTWSTTGSDELTKVIPLGFNISKIVWSYPNDTVEDYVINVYGFVPGVYDHKFFEPYQGIVCATRKSTLKFPNVQNIKAISLHVETALPDYQELRYTDTWFDPGSKLIRIDTERLKNERAPEKGKVPYQSEIAIGEMGVVFRWSYFAGVSGCKVIPFDEYENDFSNFLDIKQDLKGWEMGKLFGLNDTSYVYIGKTTKNDIPCHIFQGNRTDYPDKNANTTSLWEWCFNVNMSKENDVVAFDKAAFGLIHANVIILSSPDGLYDGYRMNHHFYEVKVQDPKLLNATIFDISKCFKVTQMRFFQFYLTAAVNDDNKHLAENTTSDLNFLQKWKAAIYRYSGIPEYSLRVTDVRSVIDDSKMFIKFAFLGIHEGLPTKIRDDQPTMSNAEINFRRNVNKEKVLITHMWGKEVKEFQAESGSVTYQINPHFIPHTHSPLTVTDPETTTPHGFSLRTEPDKGKTESTSSVKIGTTSSVTIGTTSSVKIDTTSSVKVGSTSPGKTDSTDPGTGNTSPQPDDIKTTTPSTGKEKREEKVTRHGPGAVAGVSIAMLLIGVTMGSAGTFYKMSGLPPCLKRG